ncbi:hypothetical protein FEJ81_04240 [Natrinema versiforme]|uniref:Uncharacterized protein n=1 Tax=Natrinema versiforme TaxID=88724 RepID=A0A4V1FZ98_9EURY|nr:hypothetical protein FEJ81_04240 [Natrinema versiforme]
MIIVATASQCAPDRRTTLRSVCKSFQWLLYIPDRREIRGEGPVERLESSDPRAEDGTAYISSPSPVSPRTPASGRTHVPSKGCPGRTRTRPRGAC